MYTQKQDDSYITVLEQMNFVNKEINKALFGKQEEKVTFRANEGGEAVEDEDN